MAWRAEPGLTVEEMRREAQKSGDAEVTAKSLDVTRSEWGTGRGMVEAEIQWVLCRENMAQGREEGPRSSHVTMTMSQPRAQARR